MRISDLSADIQQLAREFERCRKLLLALGDENRQHLILEMLQIENCSGARVGTKNYYYFDADTEAMNSLLQMLGHAKAIMEQLPDRSVMA